MMFCQLGSVMRESAELAISWIRCHSSPSPSTVCRSHASLLGLTEELLHGRNIHLHFPAGAVEKVASTPPPSPPPPQDGPSAGVTIATALVSLLTDTPTLPHLVLCFHSSYLSALKNFKLIL